jgi:hypothetical protein
MLASAPVHPTSGEWHPEQDRSLYKERFASKNVSFPTYSFRVRFPEGASLALAVAGDCRSAGSEGSGPAPSPPAKATVESRIAGIERTVFRIFFFLPSFFQIPTTPNVRLRITKYV